MILRELVRLQGEFRNQTDYDSKDGKDKQKQNRRSVYPSLFVASEGAIEPSQLMAGPVLAAGNAKLGFLNFQTLRKNEQTRNKNPAPWRTYFGPTANVGQVKNRQSQLGAGYSTFGGLFGFDYTFSQSALGFLFDYEYINANVNRNEGHFCANTYHVHAYTTIVPRSTPNFAINMIAAGGEAWYSVRRNIKTPSGHLSTKGKTRGAEVDGLFGMQYLFAHDRFSAVPRHFEIIPFINAQYIYAGVGAYKEREAGIADLKFYKQGFQSLRSTLGTWLQYTAHWKNFSFIPLFDFAWQREYLDETHHLYSKPLHVPSKKRVTKIYGSGRDTFLAGVDFMFEFYQRYGLEVSYDFEYNNMYNNNAFFVGFNARF